MTRRYAATLLFGLLYVALFVLGWGAALMRLATAGTVEPMRAAWLLIGWASCVTVAYFVVREKGRSLAWVVFVGFFPVLLVVALLLPYTERRRAFLQQRTFE